MSGIILFEHVNFRGAHKHIVSTEPNLASADDRFFNDRISSLVIESGRWQFFRDINFTGPASNVLGPGQYNWVEHVGIPNDSVSSVRQVG